MTNGRTILILIFVLALHLFSLATTKFTLWPEIVVYPYLLNNHYQLYQDIINPYTPIFTYSLALFTRVAGFQPFVFQLLTWGLIIIIDILIFLISQKILKRSQEALLATAFFALFSVPFQINGLWYDLVQTPIIIVSIYFFYRFLSDPKSTNFLFWISLLITIAFFIKQQIAWLIIFFSIVFLKQFGKKSKELLLANYRIFLAPIIILLAHLLFFASRNLLDHFVFWAINFPFFKASSLPGYILLPSAKQLLIVAALLLTFSPLIFSKKNDLKFFLIAAIPLILFAYPRFDYFHLIPTLATLSLVFGANQNLAKRSKQLAVVSLISLLVLGGFTARYFLRNATSQIRFFEPDIYSSAHFLKQITTKGQKVYIQNGPDQLLPLAELLPTKPWAIQFPWYLEEGDLQHRVIEGIERDQPEFIIFKPYEPGGEFQIGSYKPKEIFKYLDANYREVLQISDTLWLRIRK